ncbi:hypothetical protein B0H19DRAFT_1058248 [Mycena capillaripes]|nr:hypothetical protein B0H19DRAFT_1058248 [Mycena capillaripes]
MPFVLSILNLPGCVLWQKKRNGTRRARSTNTHTPASTRRSAHESGVRLARRRHEYGARTRRSGDNESDWASACAGVNGSASASGGASVSEGVWRTDGCGREGEGSRERDGDRRTRDCGYAFRGIQADTSPARTWDKCIRILFEARGAGTLRNIWREEGRKMERERT